MTIHMYNSNRNGNHIHICDYIIYIYKYMNNIHIILIYTSYRFLIPIAQTETRTARAFSRPPYMNVL